MGHSLSKRECEEVKKSYKLDEDELEAWVRVFRRYSRRTSSSQMDFNGFRRAMAEMHETDGNLQRIFDIFDWDRNGSISFSEFMFAMLVNSKVSAKAKMKFAFDLIDKDGNGYLDENELMDLVFHVNATKSMLLFEEGIDINERMVRETFRRMDTNGDGQISLEEFMHQAEKHGGWILRLFDIHS